MTQTTLQRPMPVVGRATQKPRRRISGTTLLYAYTWLIMAWLALPIFVMIAFGFNDTHGRINQTWQGFTLKWYGRLGEYPTLTRALWLSLGIAVVSALVSGALGTGIGYALGRYRFRGSNTLNGVMFATISSPELTMGVSLLTLFVSLNVGRGPVTITIAHIMFSISFVATVVRARVITLDRSIEEAAADLGATPWITFRKVTFPIIMPAVFSGVILAFALSIDDFVVTNFTSGTYETFPLWIWGSSRMGLPPQVNVMATLIFAVGALLAVLASIRSRPRRRKR